MQDAADWFARMSSDSVTERDCENFRKWCSKSSAHSDAYDHIARTWQAAGDFAETPEIVRLRVAALAETPDRHPRWQLASAAAVFLVCIAAGLLVVLGVGWTDQDRVPPSFHPSAETLASSETEDFATPQRSSGEGAAHSSASLSFSSTYTTTVGEMAVFDLPDGSKLTLNTASHVRVNYTAENRNLQLLEGEALFEVAKDRSRPFIVTAGSQQVVALGTVFSVRRSGEEAEVLLLEGEVRVDLISQSIGANSAHMMAGERLRILPDRSFAISRSNLAQATSWRSGRLVFDQTPLRDVLAEFNRYSGPQYVLKGEELGDLLVSGTFRIRSAEHFSAALEAGFPVKVAKRGDANILEVSPATSAP
ncbi:FecR family protein [Aurantiacibacter odishensis]|uniref:FecR family protein n=1 Tax=Aurantiacibacter odishensis TaxID=1155476 RepID=UPI0013C4A241|nr:FecR domain-containing protein [Aurantiacibacter odishensis]